MENYTKPYLVYNGQADVTLPAESKAAKADDKITKLWSKTLPKLLLAPSEEEFDAILSSFVDEREALGFEMVMEQKTEAMQEAKEKLGME